MTAFIILNPHSGGGRVGEYDLEAHARANGARTHLLSVGDDVAQLARRAADDGATGLGIAGGDGSLAPVARVAMQRDLPFLCIPAGTLNHFARDAGLDVDDPRQALRALTDGREKLVDVGELNDEHTFLNVVSLGLYAAMVADPAYRHAKGKVARERLADALTNGLRPALDMTLPDGSTLEQVLVLLVSNNPYDFARRRWNAERFRLDAGVLGLSAVAAPPREARQPRDALAHVAQRGRDRSEFWRDWTTPQWRTNFAGDEAVPVALDGESLTVRAPLRFQIRHRALRLLVPSEVPDVRPADSPLVSGSSVLYAWRSLTRWIRVTRGSV